MWRWLPLTVWAISVIAAAAWCVSSSAFSSEFDARARYDAGTRAAIAGDLGVAALELRTAQRRVPGLLPAGGGLAVRIDANLEEVRRRVDLAAFETASRSAEESTSGESRPGIRNASAAALPQDRGASDRALAIVRLVPWGARIFAFAATVSLVLALGAMRLLAIASGSTASPSMALIAVCAVLAVVDGGFAFVDQVHDARRQEAVLMRPQVPRTGPDDLTYPPAATAAWPAGAELVIEEADESGLWVRVTPRESGAPLAQSSVGIWVPRSAVERID